MKDTVGFLSVLLVPLAFGFFLGHYVFHSNVFLYKFSTPADYCRSLGFDNYELLEEARVKCISSQGWTWYAYPPDGYYKIATLREQFGL